MYACISNLNSHLSQAVSLRYNHYYLFVHLLFVTMGFSTNQVSNTLYLLKLRVQLLHKKTVRRKPCHEKRTVLLPVSSHRSHCSKLVSRDWHVLTKYLRAKVLENFPSSKHFQKAVEDVSTLKLVIFLKHEYPFLSYSPQKEYPIEKDFNFYSGNGERQWLECNERELTLVYFIVICSH